MSESDFLSYMCSFLKEHEYPLVHTMNPDEMAEVFHIANRCFLVSWAFSLLDKESFENVLKGRKQDKALLADLVCCHGFCTEKEKSGFINGELAVNEQVHILYRMFQFIERQRKAEKIVDSQLVTLEDLYALKNKELNLFPELGEIRTLSAEKRKIKMKEIQTKIEELTIEHDKVKELNPCKVSDIKKEHIKHIIDDINDNLSQFDKVVKAISKESSSKVEPNYKIDSSSTELLESCNKYLKTVTQYIDDLKTVNDFVIEDIQMPINEVSPLIEMLAEQIQTIGICL